MIFVDLDFGLQASGVLVYPPAYGLKLEVLTAGSRDSLRLHYLQFKYYQTLKIVMILRVFVLYPLKSSN